MATEDLSRPIFNDGPRPITFGMELPRPRSAPYSFILYEDDGRRPEPFHEDGPSIEVAPAQDQTLETVRAEIESIAQTPEQ